jgi:hypothetical protein
MIAISYYIIKYINVKVYRHGREADNSRPSSAKLKSGGAIFSFPHTSLWCGVYIIKHREKYLYLISNKE